MPRRLSVYLPYGIPVLVIAGAAYAVITATNLPEQGADNCPTRGALLHDAVLLDASDRLRPTQQKRVALAVVAIARQGGVDRRFSLLRLGGGTEEYLVTEFSGCSLADMPLVGSAVAEKRRSIFMEDATTFLEGLVDEERPKTPLLAATEMLRMRPEVQAGTTRLTIVSDLIEHGSEFSHYPRTPNYRRPDPSDLPEVSRFGARFAEVRIVFIQRPGMEHIQTPALLEFWVAHFKRVADKVTLETI